MAVDLETGVSYIGDLNQNWPLASSGDPLQAVRHEGAPHLRNIKTAIQGSLPVDMRNVNPAEITEGKVLAVDSTGNLDVLSESKNLLTMLRTIQNVGVSYTQYSDFLHEWEIPGSGIVNILHNSVDVANKTRDSIGVYSSSNPTRIVLPSSSNYIYFILASPGVLISRTFPIVSPILSNKIRVEVKIYKNGVLDITRDFLCPGTTGTTMQRGYYPFSYSGWTAGDYLEFYVSIYEASSGELPYVRKDEWELYAWIF